MIDEAGKVAKLAFKGAPPLGDWFGRSRDLG
jgi:hypothetical protein